MTVDSISSFLKHRVTGAVLKLRHVNGGWYLPVISSESPDLSPAKLSSSPPRHYIHDVDEDDVVGDELSAKTLPSPTLPSALERSKHMTTHEPYQSWCQHCVKGRAVDDRHEGKDQRLREVVDIRRRVSIDYCFLRVVESEPVKTVLCAVDSQSGYCGATVVEQKGVNREAVSWLRRFIADVGCKDINLHSDDETSTKALTRALATEAAANLCTATTS